MGANISYVLDITVEPKSKTLIGVARLKAAENRTMRLNVENFSKLISDMLANFPHFPQTKHLKSPRIGENELLPVYKFMQTAMSRNDLRTGAQHQMKSIAQNDVGSGSADLFWCHGFDAAIRADRHKGGCFYGAAWEM